MILNAVYFVSPLKCKLFFIVSNDCFFGDEQLSLENVF